MDTSNLNNNLGSHQKHFSNEELELIGSLGIFPYTYTELPIFSAVIHGNVDNVERLLPTIEHIYPRLVWEYTGQTWYFHFTPIIINILKSIAKVKDNIKLQKIADCLRLVIDHCQGMDIDIFQDNIVLRKQVDQPLQVETYSYDQYLKFFEFYYDNSPILDALDNPVCPDDPSPQWVLNWKRSPIDQNYPSEYNEIWDQYMYTKDPTKFDEIYDAIVAIHDVTGAMPLDHNEKRDEYSEAQRTPYDYSDFLDIPKVYQFFRPEDFTATGIGHARYLSDDSDDGSDDDSNEEPYYGSDYDF